MADIMSPPTASPPDAQAAAAARKAKRKKTRWGADVEPAKDDKQIAQAGSTEIPSVTAAPGSVFTANTPPQQELTGLKLNSSVPSGTPVPGQPSSTSASGQSTPLTNSVSGQGQASASATPPPWLAGAQLPAANSIADSSKSQENQNLPGPPPQPTAQQPWLPNSAHPAQPAGGSYPGYSAEYYYQHAGGYPAPYLQPPALLKAPAAEDDRPPGVEGDEGDEAPPGADPPAADIPATDPSHPAAAPVSGTAGILSAAANSQPQSEPQLPGPPASHPHPATAPPSFPPGSVPAAAAAAGPYPASSAAPYPQPYPHPYPQPHYPPQYALPAQAADAAEEPAPPGDEEEPQAPGTEGDAPAANPYGYPEGYTDPAYAYAQYGSYTDPQTGYTYPYDPQQPYGYDASYYGYDSTSYAQYAQTGEGQAAAGVAPDAPAGEPGPPAGSPKKDSKSDDGKPAKPAPPVVQVKLPKQYVEKQQAKKREEEERKKQELMRQAVEAEARRKAAADEAAAAAARRAQLTDMTNGHAEGEEVSFKDLDPEDQLLAASTPAEIRAAKKAIAAKEAAQKKAAAAEAAAAMPRSAPELKERNRDREPVQHERKRRTKSRWRDDDERDADIDAKASKRRRASPTFESRSKFPGPRSPSLSPPPHELGFLHRSPPRRRAPPRELTPDRPKTRRPRGYRLRRSPSPELSASPARYTPQPPQEHEPQPAPKPEPTEEKAAAEAEAAIAAREATPEVSEEGEIPVDAEEMEEISKAQQQAVSKQAHPSPVRRQNNDRGHDRDRTTGSGRDRGPPGRDRYSGGGRGDRGDRRRGRGRGGHQPDFGRDARTGFDRPARPRDGYVRPPPGLPVPQMFGQYQQPSYQEEYEEYEEGGAFEEPNIYAPQAYDGPYGVYGSALGAAAVGQGAYGQYGSYG